MNSEKDLICVFDDSDCYNDMKEHILNEAKEEGVILSECELENKLNNADYSFYWEDFIENFQAEIDELVKGIDENNNLFWICHGKNLDWQHRNGYWTHQGKLTAEEMINKITPDGDYSIKVYLKNKKLSFAVYSHDCPMGSFIDVYTIKEKTFKKYESA